MTIGSWSTRYTVSSTETGTSPRIAAWADGNADEVWFIYRNSNTVGKFRKYNVSTGQWGPIRQGYSLNNIFSSSPLGFTVGNDWIYYYYTYTDLSFMIFFQYNVLTKDGGFISQSYPDPNQTYKVFTTTTVDGISHTSFYLSFLIEEEIGPGLYRQKNDQDDFYEPELFYQDDYLNEVYDPPVNLSSGGNEVHIVWKDNLGSNNGNNLRYIYDNQPPVVPQNLNISAYNDHPKLNWDRNPDADIDFYRIYKSKGGSPYQAYATVPDYLQEYVDNNETICNPPPGWECNYEEIAGYKITAVDKTDPAALESDYSDEVKTSVIGSPPHKAIAGDSPGLIYEYKLYQNYPNPFNPSTSINYQVKDRGFVSLKVYDMLGREVAVLVNEIKEQGQYSVIFNAANLPSGVYICSLRVNDFVQNNKMTLMK